MASDYLPPVSLGPALTALLDAMAERPDPAPCTTAPRLWQSPDQIDRELAATFCRDHCPHLYLCDEAAEEEPAALIDGVWAGVDRRPTKPRRKR